MAGIGVISILDGRDYVHGGIVGHIHAVPGDHRATVRAACELMGVMLDEFTRAG
ncbi:hypothetical protein AB0N05_23960 [Nocardia sp. NPDC051030]|uniref:hypothetical protein n=1 Tax=Nocardia sp. NPDC051030 TaxID=3155162 RepID=UPI003431B7AB